MKVKIIVFNSTCLLSPNSSKDRVLLNSWWTRTGTSTPERSPKILCLAMPEETLPTMESLARVAQRSRAKASGSAQHMEAKTSVEFLLPPTCTSTRRDESFVLFDGKTDRDVRVVAFSTS